MHVGHLRSAVIGEALCRLLGFCGATVIRDNHLGDWGTQFGKLIYGYKRWADPAAFAADPIEELERLYKLGNDATPDGSPELDEARRELVKLQNGDPENVALWKSFTDVSLTAFQSIYDRLNIRFDHFLGEQFYNDKLDRIYRELTETGIAALSEGALAVFHPEHPRFKTQPFLIRKADGASNYASTDLATALYRAEHFKADAIVIVTDYRQSDHFEQLFITVNKWFEARHYRRPEMHHVTFGAVTGEERQGAPHARRRRDQAEGPAGRSGGAGLCHRLGEKRGPARGRPPGNRPSRRHRRGAVRGPFAEPQQQLCVFLGQDAGARRQHRSLPALRRGAHPFDFPQARRHAR
jgi:arginyl-tRNA synthetase